MKRIPAAFLALSLAAVQAPTPVHAQGGRSNAIEIGPGESCPAGTTEIRPRRCLAPQSPTPSIVDYRPESTLVTE